MVALMISFLGLTASAQDVYVNIENEAVQLYMSEVIYTSAEDSSMVDLYNVSPPSRRDIPAAALLPIPASDADSITVTYGLESDFSDGRTIGVEKGLTQVSIYNLIPKLSYYYKVEADGVIVAEGRIHTSGQVRMIYVPSVHNVRDLGGWPTIDGRHVKYGKIFRGTTLNGTFVADSVDLETLRQLGIAAEIDMRAYYNDSYGVSAFGFTSTGNPPSFLYTNNSGQLPEDLSKTMFLNRWRRSFQFIVNNLRVGRSIYEHCVSGADRTGYLSLLLEGLLGVTYDGLVKDYELTTFFSEGRVKSRIEPVLDYIKALEGATLQDKFNTYFIEKVKVSQDDIDYFRSEMLKDKGPSTGIDDLRSLPKESRQTGEGRGLPQYFDLTGRQVSRPQHGLLIEVGVDGMPRKVLR